MEMGRYGGGRVEVWMCGGGEVEVWRCGGGEYRSKFLPHFLYH